MPPRNRPVRMPVSNEAFTQPRGGTLRGRRGRGPSRGRQRGAGGMPGVQIPRSRRGDPMLNQLTAQMQGVQQAIEHLTNVIGGQAPSSPVQNRVESETSREVSQPEQMPVQPRGIEVSLSAFTKLNPPTFSGSDIQEEPQAFLDDVSWICKGLGCSSTRMVELAAFRLRDVARGWYESMLSARPVGSPPMEWNEFAQLFLAHFLPQSVRDSRAREFEHLVQTDQMSVMEYNIQFMRLSRYAPHLIATKKLRVQRFLEGLKSYLFRAIAGHGDMTYEQALDRALTIERGNRDRGGTSYDSRKRSRFETSRGGHQGHGGGGTRDDVGQGRRGQQWSQPLQSTQVSQTASTTLGQGTSQHQMSFGRTPTTCVTCGKTHIGPCRKGSTGCYKCGQDGHFARNCPMPYSQPSFRGPAAPVIPGRQFGGSGARGSFSSHRGGRGSGGRGQGQNSGEQARVFALTRQDAQASNAVVSDSQVAK